MTSMPAEIISFLQEHHVMSLAVSEVEGVWSANAFYHVDATNDRLLFLTSEDTRHGRAMAADPHVAGTVAGQPSEIAAIKGVQFKGSVMMLAGSARDEALYSYHSRFPFAAAFQAPIWALKISYAKLTDNSLGFGHKLIWNANSP